MEVDQVDDICALHAACARGDADEVGAWLAAGVAFEAVDAEGMTPVLAASLAGSAEIVDLLLTAGADPEVVDTEGRGLALLAAESGSVLLVSALVSRGYTSLTECAEDGSTVLLSAAAGGGVDLLRWLLDAPRSAGPTGEVRPAPSLEERDSRGADALLVAAENGHLPVIEELLKRGASTRTVDSSGCGILHFAAAGGHLEAVKFCVQKLRIKCTVKDGDGDTPLLLGAHEGNVEAVQWLLGHGSSLAERNDMGASAAIMAAAGEQPQMMEVLAGRSNAGDLWADEIARNPQAVLNFLEQGADMTD